MAFAIRKITTSSQVNQFHELPQRIYRDSPNWIPPFRFEIEKIFDRRKNPFFTHGECERFLVMKDGETVGRFALMVNHEKDSLFEPKTGGMGFIEMVNDQAVADAIIDYARYWHQKRGNGAFRGPINFGENDNYWGLLVENFDEPPIYGMFYHPPWYKELLEKTGAEKLDDHRSFKRYFDEPLPERLLRITDRIESRPGVEVRPVDLKNLYRDAEYIREIYNEAWSNQEITEREQEFSELTRETVYAMVDQLKRVMIPESVLISFVDGDPASFIVSVPDLNEISAQTGGKLSWWHIPRLLRLRKTTTRLRVLVFGTKPKYRRLGLEALTFVRGIQKTYKAVPTLKYLEGAWISEKNWLMQRSVEALGCVHHKTHRTYRWLC